MTFHQSTQQSSYHTSDKKKIKTGEHCKTIDVITFNKKNIQMNAYRKKTNR